MAPRENNYPDLNLVFEDLFEDLDLETWSHDLTLSGGGNWEFQWYTNNRSNSFVEDGKLYLQPTLTSDMIGEDSVSGVQPYTLDLWGLTPADQCTSNAFWGCSRSSNRGAGIALNPVQSAKISTASSFYFTYGRVEVQAKLPRGDWLWPAIWLLPQHNHYGSWPSSGEIDLMEGKGNAPGYCAGRNDTSACLEGCDSMSSSLHRGPYPAANRPFTSTFKLPSGSLDSDFHTYGLYWDETQIYSYVDADIEANRVLNFKFERPMWDVGKFHDEHIQENPWKGRGPAAPFDRPFYLIMNVAAGGVNGYFPDSPTKPWANADQNAPLKFFEARDQWHRTWPGRDAALQVRSVQVWQRPGDYHYRKGVSTPPERFPPWNASGWDPVATEDTGPFSPPTYKDLSSQVQFLMVATVFNLILAVVMMLCVGVMCVKNEKDIKYRPLDDRHESEDGVSMRSIGRNPSF